MSVVKGKQYVGKLAIETAADKLLKYIFDITGIYYRRPQEVDDCDPANAVWLAQHMRDGGLECLGSIQNANRVRVQDEESYQRRCAYQYQAENALDDILYAATFLYTHRLLKTSKAKNIGEYVESLRNMLHNWKRSDKDRYKQLMD